MRFLAKLLLVVALVAPSAVWAATFKGIQQPYLNITANNQVDGVSINPNTAAPGNFSTLSTSAVKSSSTTFGGVGSAITANPLMQYGFYDVTAASVNTPTANNIIASSSGRQIYIDGAGIMVVASGTAAGATAVGIYCTGVSGTAPWGNLIAKFPAAALVDGVAVNPFMVASAVTYGSAIGRGCPINQGVVASVVGASLTTTTDLFVTIPYTTQ